jgi:hypothetical protein
MSHPVECPACGCEFDGEAWDSLILDHRIEAGEVQRMLLGWSEAFCIEVRRCRDCAHEVVAKVVELLARVTDTSVRHVPGFISSALHRSLDGTKVTMYAQWRTIEDHEAMRKDPAPMPYLQEALTIAKFEPGMYEVLETFTATKT